MRRRPPEVPIVSLSAVAPPLTVPTGSSTVLAAAARATLRDLRERVGMDVWWLTRRRGEEQVVLAAVDARDDGAAGGEAGRTALPVRPWQGTVCAAMLEGRGPRVAARTAAVPAYAGVCDPQGALLGAALSVPVRSSSGDVLGTLCAFDERERPGLEGHLGTVEVQAGLLGVLIEQELRQADHRRCAESVERASRLDPVTGLLDEPGWRSALVAEQVRADRLATPMCVLDVEVEGDEHGAPAALRAAVRAVTDLCGPDVTVARLGEARLGALVPAGAGDRVAGVRTALAAEGIGAAVGAAERLGREDVHAVVARARAAGAGDVARAGGATAAPPAPEAAAGAEPTGRIEAVLGLVRRQLGAEAAFVSVFEGEVRRMRNLVSAVPVPAGIGMVEPRVGTQCDLMVTGRLDPVVPDLAADPRSADLRGTRATGGGFYVGVPLHRRDGRLYGTLCAVSRTPDPTLRPRDADVLRALAGAVMDVVEADERTDQVRASTLERLVDLRERGGLRVVRQPVVALADLHLVGVEVLARFPASTPGPAWWFAQAAAAGVGRALEMDAVRAGLALLDGPPAPLGYVALNASAGTITSESFSGSLAGRPLDRLVVEVTEHEQVEDYDALRRALAPLRARGMRLAVDDAGAGFSTMRHVLALLPDLIKLDISLVAGIDADPARRALAAALTTYARGTGAEIVAEGVETGAELACLRSLGVSYGQGRLLGEPT